MGHFLNDLIADTTVVANFVRLDRGTLVLWHYVDIFQTM